MKLNIETIKQIADSINQMLSAHSEEIEEATEIDGTVSISLPVKLEESGPEIKVKVGIGFVKTRVKDEINFVIGEQKELFD